MKKSLTLWLLLLSFSSLFAQKGAPLLTHFKESRDIENQNWAICQDVNHVMLFANRKGILSFDGNDWLSIHIPVIPFSMGSDPKDGKIFVGGENSYGYLRKNNLGLYEYVPISGEGDNLGIITRIIFADSVVWFYGEQSASCHNLKNYKLELRVKPKDNDLFTGMFVTPSNAFINRQNSGLSRVEADTLFPIVTGYLTENTDILFSLPYNNKMVLLGLGNGSLSLFDGIKYYDYKISDDGYLKDNILSEGIALGDSLYAFSTLDGGALVIDKKSGAIRFTINNQNELPDDEIFAMAIDGCGGLWLSHQYGLTRADLNLPVENFSIYPGLKGNLTSSINYNGELYVGTSEGVYYLAEFKNYSEVQVLINSEGGKNSTQPAGQSEKQQGSRRNIFSRIFGKKINKESSSPGSDASGTGTLIKPETGIPVRQTVSRLKSINYIYKRVDGFSEKCRQLVSTPDGILAATNKGLVLIRNHRAENVSGNRYINFISWHPADRRYYIGAGDGYFTASCTAGKWSVESPDRGFTEPVYSVTKSGPNTLWLGVDNAALKADMGGGTGNVRYTRTNIKNDFPQRCYLDFVNDSLFLYAESGLFCFDSTSGGFKPIYADKSIAGSKLKYVRPLSDKSWIKRGDEWLFPGMGNSSGRREMSLLKLFNEVVSVNSDKENLWVVDGENRLFKIRIDKKIKINPEIDIFVKSIYNDNGTLFDLSNIVFDRGDNIVNFDIVAPGYLKQSTTRYQYMLSKLMNDWSPWSVHTNYNVAVPVPGEFTLKVRAKDLWGNIGAPVSVKILIKAPFTRTTFFYILCGIIIFFLIVLIMRFRERQLQKENKILEEKVKERTSEIEAQKEEITSSIAYASRIQRAMLPVDDHFKSYFSDYFIIFKPRDIVSGDFYWIGEDDKNVFFTVADCTGHGVPGAFMSTLGISTLNEIITNDNELQANTVLNLLRDKIKGSLHQTAKEGEASDGMDVAFCVLNKNRKKLQYSGAYNPMLIFQSGELKEYKADRMPIGIYYGEKATFTNYEVNLNKGDTIYIFSDGLTDQFGGPDGSKYKLANLKKLLSEIYYRPLTEQRKIIEDEFEAWKGPGDQIDDITIIGVRI